MCITINGKSKTHSKGGGFHMKRLFNSKKKKYLFIFYALYCSLILVSAFSYLAEENITRGTLENDEYESHLIFPEDGEYGHYTNVVLFNKDAEGKINLKYVFKTNTLHINKCENIKELTIDSNLMYKNKASEVYEQDYIDLGTDYYKNYFKETNDGKFTIIINSDWPMEKLQFLDIPLPERVRVNNEDWWDTESTNYTVNGDDITITYIPSGATVVEIYFKEVIKKAPIAMFKSEKYVYLPNDEIYFNAEASDDEDGDIISYVWDLGDTNQDSGMIISHRYSSIGEYTVKLTVRDDDYLEDTYSQTIYIVKSGTDSDNDFVPDEIDPHPFEKLDTDGDGLSDDYEEIIKKTNKTLRDSDGDGWDDKAEIDNGTDPLNSADYPEEKIKPVSTADDDNLGVVILIIIIVIIIIILLILIMKRKGKGADEPIPEEVEPISPKEKFRPSLEEKPAKSSISPVKSSTTVIPSGGMLDTDLPSPAKPKPIGEVSKIKLPVRGPPVKKPKHTKPEPEKVKDIKVKEPVSMDKLKVDLKPVMTSYNNSKPKDAPSIKPKIPIQPKLSEQPPIENKTETIKEFTKVLGINKSKATALFNGGYTSIAQLEKASKEELMKVKGIGPKMAENIHVNILVNKAKRL